MVSRERFIFSLFLVLLPVQLGKHFWPSFSFIWGRPIDYLAPTVFLTDLLVMGLIRPMRLIRKMRQMEGKGKWALGWFLGLSAVWIWRGENFWLLGYSWLRVLEVVFLAWYIWRQGLKILGLKRMVELISWGLVWQFFLALGQFWRQEDLGLWILGERDFSLGTPGIAQGVWEGRVFLRAYGTMPHPNVLAGLGVLVLVWNLEVKGRFWRFFSGVAAGTVFLSFSRVGVGIMGIMGLMRLMRLMGLMGVTRIMRLMGIVGLGGTVGVFLVKSWGSAGQSFGERWELARASWEIIKSSSLTGAGLGNFLPSLGRLGTTRILQPVHNIYLLGLTEIGLMGLMGLMRLMRLMSPIKWGLGVILIWGLFDHFWLTTQQGRLLLALVLGMGLKGCHPVKLEN